MIFETTWDTTKPNYKNPKDITFPDNTVKTVRYMRDGIIYFTDGTNASYKRTGDGRAVINFNDTPLGASLLLYDYLNTRSK